MYLYHFQRTQALLGWSQCSWGYSFQHLPLQGASHAPKRRSWHEVVNWGNTLVGHLNGFVSIFYSGIQKLLLHFNSNPNLYPPQASCSVNCRASLATSQLSQPGDTAVGLKCIPSIVRVGEGQLRLVAAVDCAISPPLPLHHKLRPENKSHPFFSVEYLLTLPRQRSVRPWNKSLPLEDPVNEQKKKGVL